jgi:hypothetical protein
MIDHNDRARLDAIAAEVWNDDPRFATAMCTGKPRAPREYRIRRRWLFTMLAVLLIAGWSAGVLPPMLVLLVPAAAIWYAASRHLGWPDRLPRAYRGERR